MKSNSYWYHSKRTYQEVPASETSESFKGTKGVYSYTLFNTTSQRDIEYPA